MRSLEAGPFLYSRSNGMRQNNTIIDCHPKNKNTATETACFPSERRRPVGPAQRERKGGRNGECWPPRPRAGAHDPIIRRLARVRQ